MLKFQPVAFLLLAIALLPLSAYAQEQTATPQTITTGVDWTSLKTQLDVLATSNTIILNSIKSVAACSAQLNFYAPKQAKASPTSGCATP
jgi:hypothetical protein